KAKRQHFDDIIADVAEKSRRPWDLMKWVKERRLAPMAPLVRRGVAHRSPEAKVEVFNEEFNKAPSKTVDPSRIRAIPPTPEREWHPITEEELRGYLKACSGRSAPGPDHVSWRVLKRIAT